MFPLPEVKKAFPHFNILRELGSGGQGSVFHITTGSGEEAALKIYDLRNNIEKRLEHEEDALSALHSDVIASVLDSGTAVVDSVDCIFALYQFIPGENLDQIKSHRLLDEAQIIRLLVDISEAIDQLWSVRVVHRDIKPENIMLCSANGRMVLIDLALAKHLNASTLTTIGMAVGTVGYMSPEQYLGQKYLSLKSDLYSLGIVTYECSTGIHPFGGIQNQVLTTVPPPISVHRRGLDPRIEVIVSEMLMFHPQRRPQSGAAIRTRLGIR